MSRRKINSRPGFDDESDHNQQQFNYGVGLQQQHSTQRNMPQSYGYQQQQQQSQGGYIASDVAYPGTMATAPANHSRNRGRQPHQQQQQVDCKPYGIDCDLGTAQLYGAPPGSNAIGGYGYIPPPQHIDGVLGGVSSNYYSGQPTGSSFNGPQSSGGANPFSSMAPGGASSNYYSGQPTGSSFNGPQSSGGPNPFSSMAPGGASFNGPQSSGGANPFSSIASGGASSNYYSGQPIGGGFNGPQSGGGANPFPSVSPEDLSQIDQWFSNLDPLDSGKVSRQDTISFLGRFNLQERATSIWNVAKTLNASTLDYVNLRQFGVVMRCAGLAKKFGICSVSQYCSTTSTHIPLPEIKRNGETTRPSKTMSNLVNQSLDAFSKIEMQSDNKKKNSKQGNIKKSSKQNPVTETTAMIPVSEQAPINPPKNSKSEFCDTVFVGNLPRGITEGELFDLFQPCGDITNVRLAADKGYAHVRFSQGGASVDAAVGLNRRTISGRAIRVDYAPPSQSAVKHITTKKAVAVSAPAAGMVSADAPAPLPVSEAVSQQSAKMAAQKVGHESSIPRDGGRDNEKVDVKVGQKTDVQTDSSDDDDEDDGSNRSDGNGEDDERSREDDEGSRCGAEGEEEEETLDLDALNVTPAVRHFIETCQACDAGEINRCFEFLMANEWPSCLRLAESMIVDNTKPNYQRRDEMKSFITELALVHGEYYEEADERRKKIENTWPETLLNISKGVRKLKSAKTHNDHEDGHKLVKQFRREFSKQHDNRKKRVNVSTCGLYDYTVSVKQSLFVSMQLEWNKMITKLEEAYRQANLRAGGVDTATSKGHTSPWDICGPVNGKKKVIVIGGTGSGKSTFINTLTNYFRGGTLDDMKVVIPTATHASTESDAASHTESKRTNVSQSQTQDCSSYRFKNPKSTLEFEFIDTPGIGDTRGLKQDEDNLTKILTAAKDSKNLTAIVLVVNGRIPRLDGVS
jgi:hypothetical protein